MTDIEARQIIDNMGGPAKVVSLIEELHRNLTKLARELVEYQARKREGK